VCGGRGGLESNNLILLKNTVSEMERIEIFVQ